MRDSSQHINSRGRNLNSADRDTDKTPKRRMERPPSHRQWELGDSEIKGALYNNDYTESISPEPNNNGLKRRKLRKGTRSCWDCKKRKVKCTFDNPTDAICIACRRRNVTCVSQEHEESHADEDSRGQLFDRVLRVEQLLEDLHHKVDDYVEKEAFRKGPSAGAGGILTPNSDNSYPYRNSRFSMPPTSDINPVFEPHNPLTPASLAETPKAAVGPENDKWRVISQQLLDSFPSQDDLNTLCKSNYDATFFFHQMMLTKTDSDESDCPDQVDVVNNMAQIPDATTHPVLIAKRMFIIASFLQYYSAERSMKLTEKPTVVSKRLTDTAIRLVTSNEDATVCLVGCIEGLECIMLEAVYQANGGNLRRAWLAFRRAMMTAQLMKIDCPDPPPIKRLCTSNQIDPSFLWFRIVYMDRMISLMLGLPQGAPDSYQPPIPPNVEPTVSCKLQQIHSRIAGRVCERNKFTSCPKSLVCTQELDQELLNAVKTLPDAFWLPPNFVTLQKHSADAFWETMRLADQLHHFNLVHLLHLPYLLRSDEEESYYKYSKITCIAASREILTRFNAFRAFDHITTACRTADFFALTAGLTILLAHIDSHRHGLDNFLAHQRVGDRGLVELALNNMAILHKRTGDKLTNDSSRLLRSLLQVESEAIQGQLQTAHTVLSSLEEDADVLQLPVPYLGIIKIAKEGIISQEWSAQPMSMPSIFPTNGTLDSVHVPPHVLSLGLRQLAQNNHAAAAFPILERQFSQQHQTNLQQSSSTPPGDDGAQQRQALYPNLYAGINDWAFQGVDTAFFNSLMRGVNQGSSNQFGN